MDTKRRLGHTDFTLDPFMFIGNFDGYIASFRGILKKKILWARTAEALN